MSRFPIHPFEIAMRTAEWDRSAARQLISQPLRYGDCGGLPLPIVDHDPGDEDPSELDRDRVYEINGRMVRVSMRTITVPRQP